MKTNKCIWICDQRPAVKAALAEQISQIPDIHIDISERPEVAPDILLTADGAAREKFPNTPVLFYGAGGTFTRPFRLAQLLGPLHRLLQEGALGSHASVDIGAWTLNPREKILTHRKPSGETQRLTDKETALLLALHGAEGRPVPRERLLRQVWAYSDAVDTHTLETHVWRLRQKIEDDPANPALLLTGEGGYSLRMS